MRICIPSLASFSGLRILHCHELWCRLQMQLDPILLWLWCRMAAAAPIRPQSGNLHLPWVRRPPKKRKKERKKLISQTILAIPRIVAPHSSPAFSPFCSMCWDPRSYNHTSVARELAFCHYLFPFLIAGFKNTFRGWHGKEKRIRFKCISVANCDVIFKYVDRDV